MTKDSEYEDLLKEVSELEEELEERKVELEEEIAGEEKRRPEYLREEMAEFKGPEIPGTLSKGGFSIYGTVGKILGITIIILGVLGYAGAVFLGPIYPTVDKFAVPGVLIGALMITVGANLSYSAFVGPEPFTKPAKKRKKAKAEKKEEEELEECPKCGMHVSADTDVCPDCGFSFEEEVEEEEEIEELEEEEEPEDKEEEDHEEKVKEEEEPEEEEEYEEDEEEGEEGFICPLCKTEVAADATKCPGCGAEFEE